MEFTKMHGLGNDYLYMKADALPGPEEAAALALRWSDRHTGVGSDGIIWILPPSPAAAAVGAVACMRIFNADGSEAMMCGNGIRCVGKYLYDRGLVPPETRLLRMETLSGIKALHLEVRDGAVQQVSVDMGQARVEVPLALAVAGGVQVVPVNVGNPHAVIFCDDAEAAPVESVGPRVEHDPAFPGGVNVEFVSVVGPAELRMRVWERGSGITQACGTGACASVAAAVSEGLCPACVPVCVHLDGGDLRITVDGNFAVQMTGPAAFVCDGITCD